MKVRDVASPPNTRPALVVIATSWGRRHGGINSFSTDLCVALAAIAYHHRVVCVALSANDADREDAESADVVLLTLNLDVSSAADPRWTSQVFGVLAAAGIATVDHWVGHDAITGELAACCARESRHGKSTVLMHMSYADYLHLKHPACEGTTIADRSNKQKLVLQSSDFACAVGPLLFERLCEIRGSNDSVAQLIPGLAEDVLARPPRARLQAIGFGRFTAADALVKQAPLAAAGFARAFRMGLAYRNPAFRDAQLTLIGVPPDEAKQLRDLAETEAGRVVNIQTLDFLESRERLLGLLSEANACLMLSWHEGFGLAAWEAIAAGVPVVLSQNSGVFRTLESLGGAATGCVTSIDVRGRSDGAPQEEDIESVKSALLEVTRNIPASLANAQSLRTFLRERDFNWERTARTLAELIGLPVTKAIVKVGTEARPSESADVVRREAEAARRRDLFARRIGYQPDPFFKGRQAELEQLVQGLKEKKSLQIRSLVWGMGGVGKTALAVQLCHQLIARDVFADGILWYRVRQEGVTEVIKRCMIDLEIDSDVNAMTDLDTRVAEFQHRLRKLDLLIVLDNADYGPEVMRPIFDLFKGIPVLITSRREFDLPGSIRVPLGDLKHEEAIALVRDLLGMSGEAPAPSGPLGSVAEIEDLCRAVSCLPIALVLAAAYIRERRLPIRRYIAAWQSRRDRLRLLAADRIEEKEEKLRDVRACFGMSFDDLDARAKRVLACMGLWEGRDFSLAHLASVIDETVYPHADGHDGALTAACELPGGALGVTAGEDGRVLVWDLSDRRLPRAVLTVFQGAEPIADLVVGPEGRQFLIQTDAGSIAMVPSVDVAALRVARAAVLRPRAGETLFKDRVDLVTAEEGVPAIEVREGRLLCRLRLVWPSLESPETLSDVEASCEVVPDSAVDGWRASVDREWRRMLSQAWRPRPRARPGIETQDLVARMVLNDRRVKVPALPEPSTRGEASLLAHAGKRATVPTWAMVDSAEEVSEGLASVSVLLQQRSLADKVRADGRDRVRVHPLVSEFAAEHLSTEERDRAVPTMCSFYLERVRSSRKHFDADEGNIEFSLIWALQNWTPERLSGGAILDEVADALQYRGRYSLALQWSEAYVQAAERHGTDLQAGRAWLHQAFCLALCGRMGETSTALSRGRNLLERASGERPILGAEVSDLWWSWSNADYERWAGGLARVNASAETSRRLRQARMVEVDPYLWSRAAAHDWPDRGSRRAVAAKEELVARTLRNQRNRIEGFAEAYGDVEDLLSAHDRLLALTKEDLSEDILYSAHKLRLSALLAAGDPAAALTCLDALRKLAQQMPSKTMRFTLLLGEAQIALRQGKPLEAREFWEQARAFLELPAVGPPPEWFWEVYFHLANASPQPAATVLREVLRFWPSFASDERGHYHLLAAWTLVALDDTARARLAWARAEAYDQRLAIVAPWQRKTWVELYAAGSGLGVTATEVSAADEGLWGPVADRPYVLVRGPGIDLKEVPRDAGPDAKPEVVGPVEPLHLRNHPATVAELREYCAASGTPLPWYYRVQNPDAADFEWVRFTPYALAKRLAEHLDEGLPGTIGWRALPDNPAWRLPIPARSTPLPQAASIYEWLEQSPAWSALTANLLRPSEFAPGDLPHLRGLLCADPMSAIDKWRIVDFVRTRGLDALPSRLRKLVSIAGARRVPRQLATGVLARLERDWRSIAHLAGMTEVTPDAVWLRPETRKPHETFGTVEHMGAIGALAREGSPGPCLLVPDACAWADVMVWPSRLFDPTWYREEAPPWP
jgi:glycosyltransferase involved in cell wall biosynthesis